jgi:hypothetical protein
LEPLKLLGITVSEDELDRAQRALPAVIDPQPHAPKLLVERRMEMAEVLSDVLTRPLGIAGLAYCEWRRQDDKLQNMRSKRLLANGNLRSPGDGTL